MALPGARGLAWEGGTNAPWVNQLMLMKRDRSTTVDVCDQASRCDIAVNEGDVFGWVAGPPVCRLVGHYSTTLTVFVGSRVTYGCIACLYRLVVCLN